MLSRIAFVTLLLSLAGCADQTPTKAAEAAPLQNKENPSSRVQRFVPIQYSQAVGMPWPGFFALDTQTGKLCRTTDVTWSGQQNSIFNNLPLCSDLTVISSATQTVDSLVKKYGK